MKRLLATSLRFLLALSVPVVPALLRQREVVEMEQRVGGYGNGLGIVEPQGLVEHRQLATVAFAPSIDLLLIGVNARQQDRIAEARADVPRVEPQHLLVNGGGGLLTSEDGEGLSFQIEGGCAPFGGRRVGGPLGVGQGLFGSPVHKEGCHVHQGDDMARISFQERLEGLDRRLALAGLGKDDAELDGCIVIVGLEGQNPA